MHRLKLKLPLLAILLAIATVLFAYSSAFAADQEKETGQVSCKACRINVENVALTGTTLPTALAEKGAALQSTSTETVKVYSNTAIEATLITVASGNDNETLPGLADEGLIRNSQSYYLEADLLVASKVSRMSPANTMLAGGTHGEWPDRLIRDFTPT